MKREDIEKEAFKYGCESQVAPCTGGELEKGFKAGADWRINSAWHSARKMPDKGKLLIAEDIDSAYDLVYLTKSKPWEELSEKDHYVRWAYIEDLLPNTED